MSTIEIVEQMPRSVSLIDKPVAFEVGYLYFAVDPWSQDARVYIKVRSRGTLRAIRYWLKRVSDWHNVGVVTHLWRPW